MIPSILPIILPVPSAALLILLVLYHLTPLLRLLSNPAPILQKLSSIIPHPRRNLPREFFNLPPRPDDARSGPELTISGALGIRGKLILWLGIQAVICLGCGWGWIMSTHESGMGALAMSITPLPVSIFFLAIFSATLSSRSTKYAPSKLDGVRRILLRGGGITHRTLPWIAGYSMTSSLTVTIIAATITPSHALTWLLASTSAIVGSTAGMSIVAALRLRKVKQNRGIRLPSASPEADEKRGKISPIPSEQEVEALRQRESWISSAGDQSGNVSKDISGFSYPSPNITPKSRQEFHPHSTTLNGTPTSWLSSPTNSPATIPAWEYSPSIRSLVPARTRSPSRSRSASPSNLPRPVERTVSHKGSEVTLGDRTYTTAHSTPASGIHSTGGSVLGAYSPDPFQPMPRAFESLTSFPMSPDQLASRVTLATHGLPSTDNFAFVASERANYSESRAISETWTIQSYHSAAEEFKTPVRSSARRAAPPPPMPDMPLPPTPTAARSDTLWELSNKESTEMLMAERDWVEVEAFIEGSEGWGKAGRGVGIVAVIGMVICHVLSIPLLVTGPTESSLILFLISLLLPSPILIITSYLLRYRPVQNGPLTQGQRSQNKSAQTSHQSLALLSTSQLSLPISISPKLTPPTAKPPAAALNDRLAKVIEPKPSISNFGFNRYAERRHTIYGAHATRDEAAEEAMRKTLARRSGDVWLENGHAKEGGNFLSRAAEMIKPVPAMRVLDTQPRQLGVLTRLRGGIVSMLPGRYEEEFEMGQFADAPITTEEVRVPAMPHSPITINIESPSKYDRRRVSGTSSLDDGEPDLADRPLEGEGLVEVKTAQLGRMSASPTFVYGPSAASGGYDLDWMTAGVLPKIGDDVRVQPGPNETPKKSKQHARSESVGGTPRSHGRSSSIDFDTADHSTPKASSIRQRRSSVSHKPSMSLPAIETADFTDLRKSVDESCLDGIDLPPFPIDFTRARDLSPVTEADESNISSISQMAAIARVAEMKLGTPARGRLISDAPSPGMVMMAEIARRAELSLKTPATDSVRSRLDSNASTVSDSVGMHSMMSEDEAMAQEMENIMAMDTPTRTEFVTSPVPSEFDRCRTPSIRSKSSTASWTIGDHYDNNTFGAKKKASTTTISTEYTDSSSVDASPAPPLPAIPSAFRFPAYPAPVASTSTAHPYPPPLRDQLDRHRPIQPHPSLQSLLHKKSIETISSERSYDPPTPPVWKPSRQEVQRATALKERAQMGKKEKTVGSSPKKAAAKKAEEGDKRSSLRPLRLVDTQNARRLSGEIPPPKKAQRASVLQDGAGAENVRNGNKGSNGLPKPVMKSPTKSVKGSRGSGKENAKVRGAKGSTMSTGSGVIRA